MRWACFSQPFQTFERTTHSMRKAWLNLGLGSFFCWILSLQTASWLSAARSLTDSLARGRKSALMRPIRSPRASLHIYTILLTFENRLEIAPMAAEYWSTDAAASDSYVLAVQAGWGFSGGLRRMWSLYLRPPKFINSKDEHAKVKHLKGPESIAGRSSQGLAECSPACLVYQRNP